MVIGKTAVVILWALYFNGEAEVRSAYDTDFGHCLRMLPSMYMGGQLEEKNRGGLMSLACIAYTKKPKDGVYKNWPTIAETMNDIVVRVGRFEKKDKASFDQKEVTPGAVLLWRLSYDGAATVVKVYEGGDEESCSHVSIALADNEAAFTCASYTEVPKYRYSNMLKGRDTFDECKFISYQAFGPCPSE